MKELPTNIETSVSSRFSDARNISQNPDTYIFHTGTGMGEFEVKIFIDNEGAWSAILTHMDSAYKSEIIYRAQNTL